MIPAPDEQLGSDGSSESPLDQTKPPIEMVQEGAEPLDETTSDLEDFLGSDDSEPDFKLSQD